MPHVLDASKFCITWQGGWCAHLRFDLKATLQFAASFHGFQHGDLVGILDVAAHRDAHGDSRHLESWTLELLGEIRSEEHTSELQSLRHLVCRLLLEKKNTLLIVPQCTISAAVAITIL